MSGRITAPTAAYPYGSSKNETAPGVGDGTPYFEGRANDVFGFQQALLSKAGVTPSGNADTALESQYLRAMFFLMGQSVASMKELIDIASADRKFVTVLSFFPGGSDKGFNALRWDSTVNKAVADGISVIDPSVAGGFDGTVSTLPTYLSTQGTGVGTGCWVSVIPWVTPEMAGALGTGAAANDYNSIQAAWQASADWRKPCIMTAAQYGIGTRVQVPTNSIIEAKGHCGFVPFGGLADAVLFPNGNMIGQYRIPTLSNFTGIGLEVRCNLAEIFVDQFNTVGTAIKFSSGASGSASTVLDTRVNFNAISGCTTAVNYHSAFVDDVIQGCAVYGNFITNTINAVLFDGAASHNDGLGLYVLAIDFVNGGGALLNNQTGVAIPRFECWVRSWLGGNGFDAGTPTQLAIGKWVNGRLDASAARPFTQDHLADNLLTAMTVKWKARSTYASAVACVGVADILATFNGGDMLYRNEQPITVTASANIVVGGFEQFKFYHILADQNYPVWMILSKSSSINVSLNDISVSESGAVEVTIRNVGETTITAGTSIELWLFRI